MKLKTEFHITRTLWVEVPASIETEVFEREITYTVSDGLSVRLKDGITVDVQNFCDYYDEVGNIEDESVCPKVREFIRAVIEHAAPGNCAEIFFHR